MKLAATLPTDQHLLVNLSGRGDKDIGTVADLSGAHYHDRPSQGGASVKGMQVGGASAAAGIDSAAAAAQTAAAGGPR
jgi:tryptophan synthase beta chain